MYLEKFVSRSFQKQKPFAGFLPGIAGYEGLPMWVFYVNRGQCVSSFGVRDKNGAMAEFYPANLAYAYVHQQGFRTFIKNGNEVYECFQEKNTHQTLTIYPHQIVIEEEISQWQIRIKITYATMPNMPLSALMRRVELINLDGKIKTLTIVDGLTQILPAGIDYGGYKAVSNLLQSWMEVKETPAFVLLKLRASTADSSEVKTVEEGHFYSYFGLEKFHYIYDYKAVFAQDSSFHTPYQLEALQYQDFIQQIQAPVNQVPSAFVITELTLKDTTSFFGLFGYSNDYQKLASTLSTINPKNLNNRLNENQSIIESLTQEIFTKTNHSNFDAYLQQCYLDNILRGGYPVIFETKDGPVAYHLYSRKHGDLERDYNFFSLEPSFLSQGNGAFRDVLQNRRNDLYFHPEIGTTTISQFAAFLQADGYNPLSIEGITFEFVGDKTQFPHSLQKLLSGEFTPGQVAMEASKHHLLVMPTVTKILSESHYHFKATYGEGYWGDHFTYFLDLIETYLDIYPDKVMDLMTTQHPYFVSPVFIKPRDEKYVLKQEKIRQYQAINHVHNLPPRAWLLDDKQQILKSNLYAKLFTLIANKYAQLDPDEVGLMYEAERPGWNDAMNGIPGLFGSGVSELIELSKLVKFFLKLPIPADTKVITPLLRLVESLQLINSNDFFIRWQQRMDALESYRGKLGGPQSVSVISTSLIQSFITMVDQTLSASLDRLNANYEIIPTYFTYEVLSYDVISKTEGQKESYIRAKGFKRINIPPFLEAPARLFSSQNVSVEKARKMYLAIKNSSLYDPQLHLYKTSASLEDQTMEIGRIRAFTPGWLERESAFLHMTYKYLLGLMKAGLIDEFFEAMKDGMTCFMDPQVYGRSPLENSSFIATSNNPDISKHGQGFYARLSGSTAEVISIWKRMMFGEKLFFMHNQILSFAIKPSLPSSFFKDGVIVTKLFANIDVTLHYQGNSPTFQDDVRVTHYELTDQNTGQVYRIEQSIIHGDLAHAIRQRRIAKIDVYLKGGPHPSQ
jgi:hypothetical protein